MSTVLPQLALFVWVAGLLMFFFVNPKYGKIVEVGKLMFVAGLIVWLGQKN